MIRKLFPASLGALLTLAPALAIAQVQAPAQAPVRQPAAVVAPAGNASPVPDELFGAAAASGGMAELNISQIGLQRASDPELKRFSQHMIEDHTQMNQELLNLLAQKRIGIPRTIDARAQFCAESLSGLTGQEFDKCYAKAQLVMHMDAVAAFEAEAKRGQDPDIKALAGRAVVKIKEHLREIKPIAMRYEKEKNEDSSATQAGHTRENR